MDESLSTTEAVSGESFQDSIGESDTFLKAAARIHAAPLPPPDARAGGLVPPEELAALVERAKVCPVPSVGLQCLALLSEVGVAFEVSAAEIRQMAASISLGRWGSRLDVLSVEEALRELDTRLRDGR